MNQSLTRVEELMEASLQILGHMEIEGADSSEWEQLSSKLKQERERLQSWKSSTDTDSLQSLLQSLDELEQKTQQLQVSLEQDYAEETADGINSYESQSLFDQMEDEEAYHGKIDYKSSNKLIENFSKMYDELNQMLH